MQQTVSRKEKILVIDDDVAVQEILREILSDMGFEVILGGSLAQAGKELGNHPDLGIILCDYRLPDGTGLGFFRELRSSRPDTVRILITGFVDAEAAAAAIQDGEIYRFLPKPCSIDDVKVVATHALERWLEIRSHQEGSLSSPAARVLGARDASQLAGTTFGDYQIEEMIGRGGMAVVYRARQISLDRLVALKVLPPESCRDREYVDRFLREARAVAHLNHPNITQVYDAGVAGNLYFFVMEFVDGKNLGQIVKEQGRMNEKDALRCIQQAAAGLAFAHGKGIVHRDVKPENLMRTRDGVIKLGDLGLAKWKPNEYDHSLTVSGNTMGTPYYISPEQIRGLKDIDGRADVYSLGVTLYHLLAGRPPFHEGTAAEIMAQHLSDDLPSLEKANSHLSQPVIDLVGLMTEKRREDRISDMGMVTLLVTDILGESLSQTPISFGELPASLTEEERTSAAFWSRLLKMISALILGLLVALLAIISWKLSLRSKVERVMPGVTNAISKVMAPVVRSVSRPVAKPVSKPAAKPVPIKKREPAPAAIPGTKHVIPAPVAPPKIPNEPAVPSEAPPVGGSPPVSEPKQPPPAPAEPVPPVQVAKVEPAPKTPPKEVKFEYREWVIAAPDHCFMEITIGQQPFSKILGVMTSRPVAGAAGVQPSGVMTAENEIDLVVGKSDRGSFKGLVRFGYDQEGFARLLQNIHKCKSAILEIVPVYYYSGRADTYLEVEINRLGREWGAVALARFQYSPGFFQGVGNETTWDYASTCKNLRWGKPGAESPVSDFEKPALASADDPSQNSFKLSHENMDRPLRLNILPELQSLAAKPLDKMGKPMVHYGWIIQAVRGSGEIHFCTAFSTCERGPKIRLQMLVKPDEEPINLKRAE